jgi:cell division protein FtsI/penicillin-binding protein 2
LELTLDEFLLGEPGWRSTLRDARARLLIGPWTHEREPSEGDDVFLTLDSVVQQAVEDVLDWGMARYRAQGGSIVVMDPQTGAILAMATRPSFDPNAAGQAPAEHRRNRAITDLLEPGSVFKVVSAAALLEEDLVRPDEPFNCERGAYRTVGRHILHDHRPHGILPFHDVIRYSSNIGVAKAAQRLHPEVLYRYIRAFGFGEPTGIELPGEVGGIVAPPSRWSKLSPFIIPIGQEVAVTPLQLAVMMAVIANGGRRVRPYIVERIQTPDGGVIRAHADKPSPPIIRPETAQRMQSMLVSAVESGTGQLANVQGLTVAGKTGTAQKLEPNGHYSHSRYVASFAGFGPVPDSRFVIVVCMDEPRPVYFGGVVAAPMFKQVVERLTAYWALDPSSEAKPPLEA